MKNIFIIILLCVLPNFTLAEKFDLKKIIDLKDPWGSSFINENEIIIFQKNFKFNIHNQIKKILNFIPPPNIIPKI